MGRRSFTHRITSGRNEHARPNVAVFSFRSDGKNSRIAFASTTNRQHASTRMFCFTEIDRGSPVVPGGKSRKVGTGSYGRSSYAICCSTFTGRVFRFPRNPEIEEGAEA